MRTSAAARRLAALFADPPIEYRPVPQLSWNGNLTVRRIREQLQQFAARGCGGIFPHARDGHVNGYLTRDWFKLWGRAVDEARRLGLRCNIYDEFVCPAGLAGGNVIAANPGLAAQELRLARLPLEGWRGYHVLLHCRIDMAAGTVVGASAEVATHALLLVGVERQIPGLPVPDMLRRETAEQFIAQTHENYKRQRGKDFGTTVPFMFCDEPMLLNSEAGLPCSRYLMREFRRDHGYDLSGEALLNLCFERPDSPPVRFDFWHTVNRLYTHNFLRTLHDWCARNKLLFTGHLIEHEWPSPKLTPNNMAGLRWMQAPGEDLLGFQFEPTTLDANGIYLLNLKELASVVNQLGRQWSMVETCGGRGYQTAYAYFKSCEDFTLAFGVNVIDPHLAHQSLAGMGKYDWPQTLSDHSPWWAYYRTHADHVARVNTALSQGREHNRVLVLMPTTSAWMHYTGSGFDAVNGHPSGARLAAIRESQIALITTLYTHQVDFDLGDEYILAECGAVAGKRLRVGRRAYDAVVVPAAMETVTTATLRLLQAYVAAGGCVYSLCVPRRVDGRVSNAVRRLAAGAQTWTRVKDAATLAVRLREQIPPYLAAPDGRPLGGGLVWRRVVAKAGTIWFFANPWSAPLHAEVAVGGAAVHVLNTADGSMTAAPARRDGTCVIVQLDLPPRGHTVLLVSDKPAAPATPRPAPTLQPVSLAAPRITRTQPNLFYIDYCDVEAYGQVRTNVPTIVADHTNWEWQGFDRNPWVRQFRRTLIDRQPDPTSELRVRYHFSVKGLNAAARAALRVGIERPWLYQLELNGVPLDQSKGVRWFDEAMRALPIGTHVKEGKNILTMTARPFQLLCQVMPIYVIGEFNLAPAARGFTIINPAAPRVGDWTAQGLPFYPDRVRYAYPFTLATDAAALLVRLGAWEGSAGAVALDGAERGVILHPPYELQVSGPIRRGAHELAIDVLGNMKNMMGSHFSDGLPIVWSYLSHPAQQPPGSAYRCRPSGLQASPTLFTLSAAAPAPTRHAGKRHTAVAARRRTPSRD